MRSWTGRLVLCVLGTVNAAHSAEWPPIDECPSSRMSPFPVAPAPKFVRPATPGPAYLRADAMQSLRSISRKPLAVAKFGVEMKLRDAVLLALDVLRKLVGVRAQETAIDGA